MKQVEYQSAGIDRKVKRSLKEDHNIELNLFHHKDIIQTMIKCIMILVKTIVSDAESVLVFGDREDPDIVFNSRFVIDPVGICSGYYEPISHLLCRDIAQGFINTESTAFKVLHISDPEVLSKFDYICNRYFGLYVNSFATMAIITSITKEIVNWVKENPDTELYLFDVFKITHKSDIPVLEISSAISMSIIRKENNNKKC